MVLVIGVRGGLVSFCGKGVYSPIGKTNSTFSFCGCIGIYLM